ncbi:MAG TPA: glycosyltransferase family 4 protein [Gaiellaceae bacterium]|nr:glycosyltransferase family 4 protein [Gaiellaceae bacterium]
MARHAPLRVLMVGRGVVPIKVGCGGAELAMYQLGRTLAGMGHEVTVVADVVETDFPATPGLTFVPPIGSLHRQAARLPSGFATWVVRHLLGNLASFLRARRLLRSGTFDLVHAHGNLVAYLLGRIAAVPVVYTEHDSTPWSCHYRRLHERLIRRAIYRLVNVPAFRRVAAVATACDSLRGDLLDRWGIPATNVQTILNGADFDVFHPQRHRETSVAPFRRYCLFAGSLTPRKAPDLVVEALVEAPETNFVFAGDGPMRGRLEQLAAELGVQDRVAFLGSVPPARLAALYTGADLLVLPTFAEASPLVAFEAMACGTPVLSTRVAGLPEVVHDWHTGFLVKPGDVGQLAVAMRFLTADRKKLARMGAEAQRKVRKRFLWPNLARQYLSLYWRLLPEREPPPAVDAPVPNVNLEAVAA